MTKIATFVSASVLSLAVAAPAFAGWDRTQVVDPAFSRSADRQIELAAERVAPLPVDGSSAIATSDAAFDVAPLVDRAVGDIDSPHGD